MPSKESFAYLISCTHAVPIFFPADAPIFSQIGSFTMQHTPSERAQTGGDPKKVEGPPDFVYTFAHIPMNEPEQAQEAFAQSGIIYQRGAAVGITVYTNKHEEHIPATAIRISPPEVGIGVDVLLHWPDAIPQEDLCIATS